MTREKLDECNDIRRRIDAYMKAITIVKLSSGRTVIRLVNPDVNNIDYPFCVDAIEWSIMQEGMLNTLNEAVATLQKRFDSL